MKDLRKEWGLAYERDKFLHLKALIRAQPIQIAFNYHPEGRNENEFEKASQMIDKIKCISNSLWISEMSE